MSFKIQHFFFLPLVLLAGCTQKPSTLEFLGGEQAGIFSNRPLQQDEFIALVKLSSPALLTTAQKVEGKTQIDSELAKRIEEEQARTIEDLKGLSPQIRVLFRYRMVLNGIVIVAPINLQDELKSRLHIAYVEKEGSFSRPPNASSLSEVLEKAISIKERNSVKFIGAEKAHQAGVDGRGMTVGIIDTGVDYTHSMLGGAGTEEAFKAVDPAKASDFFPNGKVVGGIDVAGTEYDTSSGDYKKHIPVPDENPIDESGHGTHVAATVAGIGNGETTYSGVAPAALLHAIKVFGKDGSTGDAAVIAGLEYSADPNRDGNLDDKLHVVNLSLGSSYGSPHVLYGEAIRNLSGAGTVVVASAGNSGAEDYIVGAPSVVEEAFSVAASIDDGFHNWQFSTVKFVSDLGSHISEAIESPIAKPISEVAELSAKLVYIGLADQDLPAELAARLRGHVALIDRGVVTFGEKLQRAADAGAVGVVVANNQPGEPIAMGGDVKLEIPAIMITQALGETIKEEMKTTDVVIHFKNADKIERPELIDTLTDFSSKGPRSIDGLLKPEITAPGANIISAAIGTGNKGIAMSGTSMSGPHIAGVMALMKQAHSDLSSSELKSLVMGTAKLISNPDKEIYPLSRQGAGRVQVDAALNAKLVSEPQAISLGEVNIDTHKVFSRNLKIRNISKEALVFKMEMASSDALVFENPQDVTLAAGEAKEIPVRFRLNAASVKESVMELDGFLKLTVSGNEIHRVPVLAVVKKISQIQASHLKVFAGSEASSAGALVSLALINEGRQKGLALPFNLLGFDSRKQDPHLSPFRTRACDLQAAGYRIIEKSFGEQKLKVLQVAVKTYEAMTTWNVCELSVLIDSNGDQKADQELAAVQLGNVKGLSDAQTEPLFASVLLDAAKARELRLDFEKKAIAGGDSEGKKVEEDYAPAVVDMLPLNPFNHSTVTVVEADVTRLARRANGQLAIKVATIFNDASAVEMDDFMGNQARAWKLISLEEKSQPFRGLPEALALDAGQALSVEFVKGEGDGKLMLLMPDNRTVSSDLVKDDQMQILKPVFGGPLTAKRP